MRHLRPPTVLICAALLAGCGSNGTDKASTPDMAPPPQQADTALSVGGTALHLGDATTGSQAGTRLLPDTRVPASEIRRDGVGAGASCPDVDIAPSVETMDTVVDATLCLLNGERADKGLSPLGRNAELASAARVHTQDMIRGQFFDHVAPDGSTPVDRIRRAGYIPSTGRWVVGENLAWGTGALATPKNTVRAWMASEGHRANILRDSYKEIGFGVFTGNPAKRDGTGVTYTAVFGGIDRVTAATRQISAAKKSKRKRARTLKAKRARKARAAKRVRAAKRARAARRASA